MSVLQAQLHLFLRHIENPLKGIYIEDLRKKIIAISREWW